MDVLVAAVQAKEPCQGASVWTAGSSAFRPHGLAGLSYGMDVKKELKCRGHT